MRYNKTTLVIGLQAGCTEESADKSRKKKADVELERYLRAEVKELVQLTYFSSHILALSVKLAATNFTDTHPFVIVRHLSIRRARSVCAHAQRSFWTYSWRRSHATPGHVTLPFTGNSRSTCRQMCSQCRHVRCTGTSRTRLHPSQSPPTASQPCRHNDDQSDTDSQPGARVTMPRPYDYTEAFTRVQPLTDLTPVRYTPRDDDSVSAAAIRENIAAVSTALCTGRAFY